MTTTTWDTFFPYIQPYVPGCPEITITLHLQEAAAKFVAASEVWRQHLEVDYTTANVPDYEVLRPENSLIENVQALTMETRNLKRIQQGEVYVPSTIDNAQPTFYELRESKTLVFFPTPDDAYKFEGVLVLRPTLDALGVEDFIYEIHGRSISCGAIAELLMIPGKEWTSPELGMYYKNKFHESISDAKRRDAQRTNQRVQFKNFDGSARGGIYGSNI